MNKPRKLAATIVLLMCIALGVWWYFWPTNLSAEQMCLAKNIYWEAAAAREPEDGLRMVAQVTENRRRANRRYWGGNTYCGVVYARTKKRPNSGRVVCQFSWTCMPVAKQEPANKFKWRQSVAIAKEQMAGKNPLSETFGLATYYLRPEHSARKNVCAFKKTLLPLGAAHAQSKHIAYREPMTPEERNDLVLAKPPECEPLKKKVIKSKKGWTKKVKEAKVRAMKKDQKPAPKKK